MLIMFDSRLIRTDDIKSVRIDQRNSIGCNRVIVEMCDNKTFLSEDYRSYDKAFKRLKDIERCSVAHDDVNLAIMRELCEMNDTLKELVQKIASK